MCPADHDDTRHIAVRITDLIFLTPTPPVPRPQISYNSFMHGLGQENIRLNRKVLADIALHEPHSFKALVDQVRFMKGQGGAAGSSSNA